MLNSKHLLRNAEPSNKSTVVLQHKVSYDVTVYHEHCVKRAKYMPANKIIFVLITLSTMEMYWELG